MQQEAPATLDVIINIVLILKVDVPILIGLGFTHYFLEIYSLWFSHKGFYTHRRVFVVDSGVERLCDHRWQLGDEADLILLEF